MRVGIIAAMASETELLRERLEDVREQRLFGQEVFEGRLSGTDVVLAISSAGKVNAALCAQMLILRFGVTHIINTGAAGSLDPRLAIGDIVLSTEVVHHDVDCTALGLAPGLYLGMDVSRFSADARMRQDFKDALAKVLPDVGFAEGLIASGDQFIASEEGKRRILDNFDALCCEMEGAGIGHTCYLHGVPFLVVRAMSDKADESASVGYPTFERMASARNAEVLTHLLGQVDWD